MSNIRRKSFFSSSVLPRRLNRTKMSQLIKGRDRELEKARKQSAFLLSFCRLRLRSSNRACLNFAFQFVNSF